MFHPVARRDKWDRRQNGAVTRRIAVAFVVLAFAAAGCEGPGRVRDPSPTPGATAISPGATPGTTPAKTAAAVPGTPKGWKTYSFPAIGLRFAYPPLEGTVGESTASKSGPRRAWVQRRTDLCDPRGNCRTFEFAAVNDGCPDAAAWPTFAHRWTETASSHRISTCAGKNSFAVDALRTIERPDGLVGIVYDANAWFPAGEKIDGALAAVLNFPAGYHDRFEAIAFYFEDGASVAIAETVLRLVRLTG